MRSFKDRDGVEWQIDFNIGTAIDLKDRLGIDLDSNDQGLIKLASSATMLFQALYVACEKQAIERWIDAKAFYAKFAGDSIIDANAAFIGALTDFFPNTRRREVLNRIVESFRVIEEKSLQQSEQAAQKLEEMLTAPSLESGNESGQAPESLESAQAKSGS
jgi:transcription initiation factor TFIIIB Brf1 subunit/transcription initiation factor TFIIB